LRSSSHGKNDLRFLQGGGKIKMSAKFKLKSVSKAAATLAGVKTIIIMMNTLCKHGSNFSRGTKFIIMKVVTHF